MNPELQRNLWLEASRRQLAAAGAILALVFVAVWLLDRGRSAYDFISAGALVFIVCGLVWGPREARGAVTQEVYARTWDFQRLSALTPWTMTWGKLAGSTSRVWVFAGTGLVIAVLQLASISSAPHALYWAMIGVGAAVLLQAAGMAVGLIEVRKARAVGRLPGLRSPGLLGLVGLLLALGGGLWASRRVNLGSGLEAGALGGGGPPLHWWGHPFDPSAFGAISLLVFAGFAVLWAWRMMRLELQALNAPWAWPLFVVTAGLYAAGFDPPADLAGSLTPGRLGLACAVFAACAYLGAFIDPADRVLARQFAVNLVRGRWSRLSAHVPLIAAPMVLLGLTAVWAAAIRWREDDLGLALLTLAGVVFVKRDLGVIAALRFTPRGRGGDVGVVVALALLYVAGSIVGRVLGGEVGLALFAPSASHPAVSLAAGVVEAVLAWALAAARIAQPSERASAPGWPTGSLDARPAAAAPRSWLG